MIRVPHTRRVLSLAALTALSFVGTGCVSQEDWLALKADRDNLAEQLADAQLEARGNSTRADSYKDQLALVANGQQAEGAMLANAQTQLATVTSERDELMRKYQDLLTKIGTGPALPVELTSELTQFAVANPDLVTFDADRGIVKFKSDVTFQSGDAELTPEAKTAIEKFAAILKQPIAQQYELAIAGHTDDVKNFSAMTVSKGHKDNWYLSSHRAIGVATQLIAQGIDSTRIGVTGFADQRPVASNATDTGRTQNRRVEVMILPTTVQKPAPVASEGDAPQPTPAATTIPGDDSASK